MRTYTGIATVLCLFALLPWLGACGRDANSAESRERCLDCHQGLETASPSHDGCTSCHGGNPDARDKEGAHRGICPSHSTQAWPMFP